MRRFAILMLMSQTISAPSVATPDGATQLTTLTSVSDPVWSPDGQTIAFGHDFDIWTIPATGGTPVRLTSDSEFDFGPAWSPDGSQIAFFRDLDIWVVDPASGVEAPLLTGDEWQQWPTWSPTGTRIAYGMIDGSSSWEVWITNLTTGNTFPIVQIPGRDVLYPAWSPDGRYIAFEVRQGGSDGSIGIVDVVTGDVEPLVDLSTHDGSPAWAPSGGFLVFETERDAVGGLDSDIWMMPMIDGIGGDAFPLSCSDTFDISPAWSPNGDAVVFLSQRGLLGGQFDLYLLGPDAVAVPSFGEPSGPEPVLVASPNPSRAGVPVRFSTTGPLPGGDMRILDAAGRLVRTIAGASVGAPAMWDGRSVSGRPVAPGVYFVKAGDVTSRVVLLR